MIPCAPSKLSKCLTLTLAVGAAMLGARSASAASTLRADRNLFGDAVVIGNMLAWDCANASSSLVAGTGTVGACGNFATTESGSDVFWTTDGTGPGTVANTSVTLAQARSRAVLALPTGATVAYARLYWSARVLNGTSADTTVTLTRPGVTPLNVVADHTSVFTPTDGNADDAYYGTADVTDFVAAQGAGTFEVGGVNALNLVNFDDQTTYAGWSLVVFYQRDKALYPSEPLRNLTIFDGLDRTQNGSPAVFNLSGFRVPDTGFDAKLSVVAYEGDNAYGNDTLVFRSQAGANTTLGNSFNPSTNFFNGTRSRTSSGSTAVSAAVPGDLPQVTGAAGSLSGMDIDTVDITSLVAKGNTSARVTAGATGLDRYFLNLLVFSAATLEPAFDPVKGVVNTSRADGTFRGGDVLEYTITATNTGTDPSIDTYVADPLPTGLTYVPGSASVVSGTGTFVGVTGSTLRWNVGTGSSASAGGELAVGASIAVRFRATLNVGFSGNLDNDARIVGAGKAGASEQLYPTRPPLGTGPTRIVAVLPAAPAISAPSEGQLVTTVRPVISGTAEASTTVIVTLGGVELCRATASAAGAWSCTPTSNLPQGASTVSAAATDASGNTGPAATRSFTVDTVAPETELLTGPAGAVASASASFTFGSADPTATFECSLDGAAYSACSSPATYSDLGQGGHTLLVRAMDPAANVDASPASRSWSVDTMAPDTTIVSAPPLRSSTSAARFDFSSDDPAATYQCQLDGAAFAYCANPESFLGLSQGTHTLSVRAVDAVGNVDPSPAQHSWHVDTAAPDASIVSGPAALTRATDATFDLAATESDVTYECSLDAEAFAACSDPERLSGLAPGAHTFAVRAVDAAGNVGPSSATWSWTVDLLAPDTLLTGFPATPSRELGARFTFESSESGATFECKLDAAAFTACSSPLDFNGLSEGAHTFLVRALDGVGNVDDSPAQHSWLVDSLAPAAPQVSAPLADAVLSTHLPTFTGMAEPGATLTLVVGGVSYGPIAVSAEGTWSFSVPAALGEGPHTAQVTARDAAGNTSPSASVSFQLDTGVPAAPVIVAPAHASTLATASPVYTGTAEPGATVTVRVDGVVLGTVEADGAGAWSLDEPRQLDEGAHTVSATATDAAGNTSAASLVRSFTVDLTAPALPVVLAPGGGSTLPSATPVYRGTAEAGATVEVVVDGVTLGFVLADPDGSWTLSSALPLGDGLHDLVVYAVDVAGNSSSGALSVFTVDTGTPAAPVISAPAAGSTVATTAPTYAGTAEPGATVTVKVDGVQLGVVVADASGSWSLGGSALADGDHSVSATATDAAGNESPEALQSFRVDTAAPSAPVVTAPAAGESVGSNTPTLTGTAEPGSSVTLVLDGVTYGPVPVAADGTWSFTLPTALADGRHTVSVTATDAAGNPSGPASVTFATDTQAPATPVVSAPAAGAVVTSPSPLFAGTAEPSATVSVVVDGVWLGTAVADASGRWSLESPHALVDGPHAVEATATDAAGNVSGAAHGSFSVDSAAPAAPAIVTPAEGAVLANASPLLSGTAEPGAVLALTLAGVSHGPVQVDAAGYWSFTPASPLADGPYTLDVQARDAAGNVGPVATSRFSVDTLAPAAPSILVPADGSKQGSVAMTYSGLAEPGATVSLSVDGTLLGQTVADAQGAWSLAGPALADGVHTARAAASDAAGNVGSESRVAFTVDTALPETLIDSAPALATQERSAAFTFSASPVGIRFECSLDGAAFAACTTPLALSGLSEGLHLFQVRALDAQGRPDPTPAEHGWSVDRTPPPAALILSPADGARVGTATPAISGTATEATSLALVLDGVSYGPVAVDGAGTWHFTLPAPLASGAHDLSVTPVDAAGNIGPEAHSHFVVDLSRPETELTSGPEALSRSTSAALAFGSSGGVRFECSLDGGAFSACVSPVTLTGLEQGEHRFQVRAINAADREDLTPAVHAWTVDTVAPSVAVSAPAASATLDEPSPVIRGTAEAGATVTVSVDGQTVGTVVASSDGHWSLPPLAPLLNGPHAVSATARDEAGNVSAPVGHPFTVSARLPETTLEARPEALTRLTDAHLAFRSDQGSARFECSPDGAAFSACSSPLDLGGLADGPHTFQVRAVDSAGNVDPTPATVTWTVDTAAPDTEILSGPAALTKERLAAFDFRSEDAGARFECSLDGAAFATCAAPAELSILEDGEHTLAVRAVDAAGNADPTPATHVWTVDSKAPSAPLIATPADGTSSSDTLPEYTGKAEAGARVTVVVDGQVVGTVTASASGDWSLTSVQPLSHGVHTVSATAQDAAGNTSAAAQHTFTVDTAAPDTRIVSGPVLTDAPYEARFELEATEPGVTFECSLDGAAFVGCPSELQLSALALGAHTLAARATDAHGNTDPTPATHAWSVNPDSDGDGIRDEEEAGSGTDPRSADTDGDGLPDGTEDADHDGQVDAGETDPKDDDSDDDGLLDGNEDTDHDGQVDAGESNPLEPDSDEDGLLDGTERGLTQPEGEDTDAARFVADADPGSRTSPVQRDSDGGGVFDGIEDANRDGRMDAGETDPVDAADDVDADRDGIDNDTERTLGLDAFDADTDDDGVTDGVDGTVDTDGDGRIDALDTDSDADGLLDGTERGVTVETAPSDTDTSAGAFAPDSDPSTTTDPHAADTDGDRLMDGSEDKNHNGRVDPGETDPNKFDSDGDGIGDGTEEEGPGGTDPTDPDSDGDGVSDGDEDPDHDGIVDPGETDPSLPDTDGDGIEDGVDTEPEDALGSDTSRFRVQGGGCSTGGAGLLAPFALLLLLPLLRSRHARGAAGATALVSLLSAGTAQAQASQASQAIDVQQFKPGPGAEDLLGVYSPHVARHFDWTLGATLNGADDPLVLVEVSGDQQTVSRLVDSQYTLDLMGSVGLFGRFELGAALPVTLQRSEPSGSVDPDFQQGGSTGGVGDLRLVPRARLLEGPQGLALGVAVPVLLPTAGGRDFLGGSGVGLQPQLLAEWRPAGLRLAANVGVSLRTKEVLRNLGVGNALSYGLGAELPFALAGQRLAAQATLMGAMALGDGQTEEKPLELLAALRWNVDPRLAVQVGAGPGLSHGYGTPDYRVLVGFTYRSEAPRAPAAPAAPTAAPAAVQPVDGDADGLPDGADACPAEAETRNGTKDEDGCPEADVKVRVEAGRIAILDKVYFATSKELILERSFPLLRQVAAVLDANPQLERVRVEGHTDSRGDDAKNLDLSQRRAKSVRAYLVRAGVAPERLEAAGYGETQPVDDNRTAAGRDNNRRVEFKVLDTAADASRE